LIAALKVWWGGWWEMKDCTSDPKYKEAITFKASFEPLEKVDYEWVNKYAEYTYQQLHGTFKYIDEKADSIIKYLSGGTAIVAIAAVANVTSDNAVLVLLLLPAFLCALFAIFLASSVRVPSPTTAPPDVKTAIDYADAYDVQGQATFLGLWHATCEGLAIVNERKAEKVMLATRFYVASIALLIVPIVCWPAWKLLGPSKSAPVQKIEIISSGSQAPASR